MNNIYSIDKYTTATAPITYNNQVRHRKVFLNRNTKPVIDTIMAQHILKNIFV